MVDCRTLLQRLTSEIHVLQSQVQRSPLSQPTQKLDLLKSLLHRLKSIKPPLPPEPEFTDAVFRPCLNTQHCRRLRTLQALRKLWSPRPKVNWSDDVLCARGRFVCMAGKKGLQTDGELVSSAIDQLWNSNASLKGLELIDIGINLADPSYDRDRKDVIERAQKAGVSNLVITGSCIKTSKKAQQIANENEGLYFTAGVHPHNAKDCGAGTIDELRKILEDPKCVAVGECGLDFNRNFSPPEEQERWFNEQVKLAVELKKPLFLHNREATDRFAHILRQHTLTAPAVAHCFTGDGSELKILLDLGLHIGITGWVCDERPDRGGFELGNLLSTIPEDKLMLETDGPYITPRTIRPNKARPRRNEPALIPYVLEQVSACLSKSPSEVAKRTSETATKFFNLKQST